MFILFGVDTPDGASGTILNARNQTQLASCKAHTLPIAHALPVALTSGSIFFIIYFSFLEVSFVFYLYLLFFALLCMFSSTGLYNTNSSFSVFAFFNVIDRFVSVAENSNGSVSYFFFLFPKCLVEFFKFKCHYFYIIAY